MRDALPNATYLGFSGTPIEKADADTRRVFGEYIDIYDIARAVEDKATVGIYYESRLVKIGLSEEGQEILKELDSKLVTSKEQDRINAKATRLCEIVGAKNRLEVVAKDIVEHFSKRQEALKGKAMIVCMSREIAVSLYDIIVNLMPSWHSDDYQKGALKVIMTANSSDGAHLANTIRARHKEARLPNVLKILMIRLTLLSFVICGSRALMCHLCIRSIWINS